MKTTEWTDIQKILEKGINPQIFRLWIKPLTAEIKGDCLALRAPNEFIASWVRERQLQSIQEAARRVTGRKLDVRIDTCSRQAAVGTKSEQVQYPLRLEHAPASRWHFSFDEFVIGPSNEMACLASKNVCGGMDSSQLFLCSSPGLGKTHLLQAIGRQVSEESNRKSLRVMYLTAEEFATRFIAAINNRDTSRFKAQFRDGIDILLLEDIHFIQGKTKTQDELLATLKALQARGSRVVLTSSFLPRELSEIDDQLGSRLGSGLIAVIDKPDYATRIRILEAKAKRLQVSVPTTVVDLLAQNITTDIRQLESCLQNLVLKARLLNAAINDEMALDILVNYSTEKLAPRLENVIQAVCRTFSLSPEDLGSKSKKRQIVIARNTAFFLARKYTDLSLKDIGQKFNRRHSTVIKGITNLEREMTKKTPFGRQIRRTIDFLER